MFCHMRLFTLLLGWCTASALAGPVWWMGAYNFRCKPPGYIEVTLGDWNGEWRVSSICKPGTCCSNYASTGPLCTVEACEIADKERERLTISHNYAEARKKKKQQEDDERKKESKEQEAMNKWKAKEAQEDKEKQAALVAAS